MTVFVLIIAIALFSLVYFCLLDKVTFVQDKSYNLVVSNRDSVNLRIELLKNGKSLKRVVLDNEILVDSQQLKDKLDNIKQTEFLVFSPVVSSKLLIDNIQVKREESTVIGISNIDNDIFDITLFSDEENIISEVKDKKLTYLEPEMIPLMFFSTDEKTYVVDYRFVNAIPKKNIQGVIKPNLSLSIISSIRDLNKQGKLFYEYSEI